MAVSAERIAAVRNFNRFYTRRIGVLQEGLLKSAFSLTQVRVLYELANHPHVTASEVRERLGLDAGYLSRMLQGFEEQGFIARTPSKGDARRIHLVLTKKGQRTFAPLDSRANNEVAAMLQRMSQPEQARLIEAMNTIRRLTDAKSQQPAPYVLRSHRPGDIGWIIQRHGVLYYEEYGWDERFEALVAEIAARFILQFDRQSERCWIAEQDGQNVGCVVLVKESQSVARLRLLLVEPEARGLGIGGRLVEECITFAKQAGFGKIVLWTQNVLTAARKIYQRAGFRLVKEETHNSFGYDLVGETWERDLGSGLPHADTNTLT